MDAILHATTVSDLNHLYSLSYIYRTQCFCQPVSAVRPFVHFAFCWYEHIKMDFFYATDQDGLPLRKYKVIQYFAPVVSGES